jgi:glycerol-3-phosphate O-acyltransferase
MEKNSKSKQHQESEFLDKLHLYTEREWVPKRIGGILGHFFDSYKKALQDNHQDITDCIGIFLDYLDLVKTQIAHPFNFEPYHKMVRAPYDHHQFGIDFIKPLVHLKHSTLLGKESLSEIEHHLKQKHNVILLANHQIEADPQAIFILLELYAKELIEHLIFVAGERVITDPLAVPFSLGCNLLCIYSKRYIDTPPEKKTFKQHHNSTTMKLMRSLLDEGGHCIYVAPSGGRDRPDQEGNIYPALFDPQSVEMFYLMACHAAQPTFFYTLALSTYSILPPPETVQTELGELRKTQASAIHLAFGKQLDMEHFPDADLKDKHLRRKARTDYIYNLLCEDYKKLLKTRK